MIKLSNETVLLASLLGNSGVKQLQRVQEVDSRYADKVLPILPFLPIKNKEKFTRETPPDVDEDYLWKDRTGTPEGQQFWPLSFEDEAGNRFTLPYEPLLTIDSKNNITTRTVAKMGNEDKIQGTVKERWSRDDYSIKVTGVLMGHDMRVFPKDDFERLRDILIKAKRWTVYCEPLQLLGINHVVVESMSFPFSKGENVQAYEINLLSDFPFNLLIEEKDVL